MREQRSARKLPLLYQAIGKVLGDHDDAHVYELPFLPNRAYWLIQGYAGAYSHAGSSYYSLDFAMPIGEPVCAARAGTVVRVVDHFGTGSADPALKPLANKIKIRHADNSVAEYLHLDKSSSRVRVGENLAAGQVIARSGNSGWSSCPHLHFAVRTTRSNASVSTLFATIYCKGEFLREGVLYARRPRYKALAPLRNSWRMHICCLRSHSLDLLGNGSLRS